MSKATLISPNQALPGREQAITIPHQHTVLGNTLHEPYPDHVQAMCFGMGCFWGAERLFWKQKGVYTTAVGYAGGYTPNPTYEEVCTGQTGHSEVVWVVYDPSITALNQLLNLFWENHDPTQGMRQGADRGTQYRSCLYTRTPEQLTSCLQSQKMYQSALNEANQGEITTEITPLKQFYFAEAYHQQYLDKNPQGYCGIGGTGICLPPWA